MRETRTYVALLGLLIVIAIIADVVRKKSLYGRPVMPTIDTRTLEAFRSYAGNNLFERVFDERLEIR